MSQSVPLNNGKLPPLILSGFSSRPLARGIAGYMQAKILDVNSRQFDDHEIYNEIPSNVRGREVIVIASASGDPNKQIIETVMISSAAKDAEAKKVTLVIPYLWYGRGDGTWGKRTSPSLNVITDMLRPHADRFIVVDPHNNTATGPAFRGQEHKGYEMVHMAYPWAVQIKDMIARGCIDQNRLVLMHADSGGTKRIGPDFRECMYHVIGMPNRNANQDDWPQGIKHRDSRTGKMKVDGLSDDVKGKDIVVFEDMISSGGTACELAGLCKEKGANSVILFATNGLMTHTRDENLIAAVHRINSSKLDFVGIMDTYSHVLTDRKIGRAIEASPIIHQMPSAQDIASVLRAMHLDATADEDENSVSALLRGRHAAQAENGTWKSKPVPLKPKNPLILRGTSPQALMS